VIFYRDGPIDTLTQPAEIISNKIGAGDEYVIMSQNEWRKISDLNPNLPAPLLKSEGTGPEGDAPLVLFKGRVALIVRVFWELISSVQKDKIGDLVTTRA
jgi:hypothetical protein